MKRIIITLTIIIATLNVFGQKFNPVLVYNAWLITVDGNIGDTIKISADSIDYVYILKGGIEVLAIEKNFENQNDCDYDQTITVNGNEFKRNLRALHRAGCRLYIDRFIVDFGKNIYVANGVSVVNLKESAL